MGNMQAIHPIPIFALPWSGYCNAFVYGLQAAAQTDPRPARGWSGLYADRSSPHYYCGTFCTFFLLGAYVRTRNSAFDFWAFENRKQLRWVLMNVDILGCSVDCSSGKLRSKLRNSCRASLQAPFQSLVHSSGVTYARTVCGVLIFFACFDSRVEKRSKPQTSRQNFNSISDIAWLCLFSHWSWDSDDMVMLVPCMDFVASCRMRKDFFSCLDCA